jgi:hypothetical protein
LIAAVSLDALTGLAGDPAADPNLKVLAFDIRVLDADPNDVLTATFDYSSIGASGQAANLLFFDGRQFAAVQGSTSRTDTAARTVTVTLDARSTPALTALGGTIFTISVPTPTPDPASQQATAQQQPPPFGLVTALNALPGLGNDAPTLAAPAETTGLVSSSGLTLTLTASEGLRRDGGGELPPGLIVIREQMLGSVLHTVFEIRDFLEEAFRMWLDQPAPLEAPALLPPPDPTILDVNARVAELNPTPAAEAPAPPAEVTTYEPVALDPAEGARTEPVIAPAETHPWWLAAYEKSGAAPADDQPIPIPSAEPSEEDRVAAALTAVWLGGVALEVSAPEPPAEDEPPPRPAPDDEDETDE